MKPLVKKICLLLVGVLGGVLVSECGLRVLGIGYPLIYGPDPYCGRRLLPESRGRWSKEGGGRFEINQEGFRHGARQKPKPSGAFRIAVLGDSFIEALQVNEKDSFCAALEAELSAREPLRGRRVEALNFGVSGFGTAQELEMLRHYVWDYDPDMVLLMLFPGNDVRNNSADLESDLVRPFYRKVDGQLQLDASFLEHPQYQKALTTSTRWKVALINHVRILQVVNEARGRSRVRQARGELGLDDLVLAPPTDEKWTNAWEVTETLIGAMAEEVQERGCLFQAAIVGSAEQVHPEPAVRQAKAKLLGRPDVDYPHQRLARWGRENEVDVLPLAPEMRRLAESSKTHLHGFAKTGFGVGHWNASGHLLAARITAERICEKLKAPAAAAAAE